MDRLTLRMKTYTKELRQDADVTDELIVKDHPYYDMFQGMVAAQRASADEIDEILDEHECSCQAQ